MYPLKTRLISPRCRGRRGRGACPAMWGEKKKNCRSNRLDAGFLYIAANLTDSLRKEVNW